MSSKVQAEAVKTIAFGAISAVYASVGAVTSNEVRLICITNGTEGDMYFTTNTAQDEYFVAAGSNKIFDCQANNTPKTDAKWVYEIGTQFSVKQIEVPISGSVYIECLY